MVGKRSSYLFLVTSITRMIFTFITSILCIAKFNIYEVCAHSFDRTRNLRRNLETSIHELNGNITSCGDLAHAGLRCNGRCTCTGGCTVLVNDLRSTYQSCENYCQGHNRQCVGAWDADDYSCRATHMTSCDFNVTANPAGPPDALCKCSTELFPPAPSGPSKFVAVSSDVPSDVPSSAPNDMPSFVPSDAPSNVLSSSPSDVPSDVPSSAPNDMPTVVPSDAPSHVLSSSPSDVPSDVPSSTPSTRPARRPVEDPTCGNLTQAKVRCNGGCSVLVNDLSSTYRSCDNYCQGHNRQCVGAWEEDENSCAIKETYGCDFQFTHTSDALCRCSTELFPNDSGINTRRKYDSSGESSTFYHDILSKGNSNKIVFSPTVQPKCPKDKVSQTGYQQFSSPTGRHYDEISMIAVSQQTWKGQPVIWIANDKDENHVYASALYTGEHLCSVELPYNMDNDIESMSIGPCNTDRTTSCLYVANIGNNLAQACKGGSCNMGAALRSIFKFKEPNIHRQSGKVEASVAILPIDYRDISSPSERADAEAFFVDFTGDTNNGKPGDLYIVTKWNKNSGLTRLFKYPVEFHENAKYGETSELYSVQPTKSSALKKRTWTDADMSIDGSLIAVRDGKRVYFFTRSSSESVTEALKKKPCKYVHKTPRSNSYAQFEAIGFLPHQNAFAEISECKRSNYGNCDPHAYVVEYK